MTPAIATIQQRREEDMKNAFKIPVKNPRSNPFAWTASENAQQRTSSRPRRRTSLGKSFFPLAGLAMALIPVVTRAQSSFQPGVGIAMIGIATGQSARLNALNMGTGLATQNSSCSVTL